LSRNLGGASLRVPHIFGGDMLSKWESRWALVRTVCAILSVVLQTAGLFLVMHYNHLLFHK
jgi:hypothetical protein